MGIVRSAGIVLLGLVGLVAFAPGSASAATCGNGTCEPGETAGDCPDDCLCRNTASSDYGLCCTSLIGSPSQRSGECTIKAICGYATIGGCCCAAFDFLDPSVCTSCVGKDEISGWCSGGIGAFEGHGSCGPAVSPVCEDTELTDEYVDGVNLRTRCMTTSIPLGVVAGGGDGFDLEVQIVYNEGRPPPAEIAADFSNQNTGPYGVGGWLSVDKIFTVEGVYWSNTDDSDEPSTTGVMSGSRRDANGNGFIGYTLHTPYGMRTYDHPVVMNVPGYRGPVGVFRSEPFDGKFLRVEEPTAPYLDKKGRRYILFQHPNGPWETYDWPLSNPANSVPYDPDDPLRTASLLSEINVAYSAPNAPHASPRWIKMLRGRQTHSNVVEFIVGPPSSGWQLNLTYGPTEADGGMTLGASPKFFETGIEITFTERNGFHPDVVSTPGREGTDQTIFEWDEWRLKSFDLEVDDDARTTVYHSTVNINRDGDNLKVESSVVTSEVFGISEGERATRFEACDLSGMAFQGTTVSLPYDVRTSYEYGDAEMQHRLIAQTSATGVRTQFRYNDSRTEPRYELVDAGDVPSPTDPMTLSTMAFGSHIDWQMLVPAANNQSLFPAGTFAGGEPQGIPVIARVTRTPDGRVIQENRDFDMTVYQPRTMIDDRGITHAMTYFADTGELETYSRQGLKWTYVRSYEEEHLPISVGGERVYLQTIETFLEGAAGMRTSLGTTTWDIRTGHFYAESSTGLALRASAPTSGYTDPLTIRKRVVRRNTGEPVLVETYINGALRGQTDLGWNSRRTGPTSASSTVGGTTTMSATPNMGPGVDGLGSRVGSWQISGPGQRLSVESERNALGGVDLESTNGLGMRMSRNAGPNDRTVSTSITRISPNGQATELTWQDSTGTSSPLCE